MMITPLRITNNACQYHANKPHFQACFVIVVAVSKLLEGLSMGHSSQQWGGVSPYGRWVTIRSDCQRHDEVPIASHTVQSLRLQVFLHLCLSETQGFGGR